MEHSRSSQIQPGVEQRLLIQHDTPVAPEGLTILRRAAIGGQLMKPIAHAWQSASANTGHWG